MLRHNHAFLCDRTKIFFYFHPYPSFYCLWGHQVATELHVCTIMPIFIETFGKVICDACNNILSVLHLETRLFLQKDNISIIKDKVSNHNISKNLKHYEILNVLRTLVSLCAKPVCTDISQCKNHQPSF